MNITIYEKEDIYFLVFLYSTKHENLFFSNGQYFDFFQNITETW